MQHEREIDALLSGSEAGSIIDRLMALPQPKDDGYVANEWDRAVSSRFQSRLVNQMPTLIEGATEAHRSAA